VIISGMERTSFVDYPGKIATVLFSPGCNYACYYCHNWRLLKENSENYTTEEVLTFLEKRKGRVDAVVFSGGEPTLQTGLETMIRTVRAKGFSIKLDTNGMKPDCLERLLKEQLLDYVAMDIKAPQNEKYAKIVGVDVDFNLLNQSINLLMSQNVPYEFRTTFVPYLTQEDICSITDWVYGAKRYVLQQYRRPQVEGKIVDLRLLDVPHSPQYIKETMALIAHKVQSTETRGI
jgi:pyruvate formate lyase activating enzyme